jgi:sodium transport system permease protein
MSQSTQHSALAQWLAVFLKEVKDAWRDRRTLRTVLLLSLVQGPVVLLLISTLASEKENRIDKREIYAQGMQYAPDLQNFIERQAYTIKAPPADAMDRLAVGQLEDAIVVVPADFEQRLQAMEMPAVEIYANSSSRGSGTARDVARNLLQSYAQERVGLTLALRGVAVASLKPLEVQERDMANANARAAQLTGSMIPLYVLIAVLTGAMGAAMDTTAGERERSSLEPLMMNPVSPWALALGKWGAVAALAAVIALLTSLSFIPAQVLIRSDALQALFRYGLSDAMRFGLICLPFAGAVAALLMASSIRGKSIKEAQAGNSLVLMVFMLLPLVSLLNDAAEPDWYYLVPSLAQQTLMLHVLRAEPIALWQWLLPFGIGLLLTVVGLAYVGRAMRSNAVH